MGFAFLKYIPIISTLANSFITKTKHDIKIKAFNQTKEKIDTMEHLMIKIDKKVSDCRHDIEELRKQLICSRVVTLIFGVAIVLLIIFLR